MSDQIWLAVIIAVTLVIFGILYRRQFKEGKVKVGQEGLEAGFQTHAATPPAEPNPNRPPDVAPPASNRLTVRNVDMIGSRNRISAQGDVEVSDVQVLGEDQSLTARSEGPRKP